MGCQISAESYAINYSRGAWLVAEMCSIWFVAERDMDDPKYGQQCWVDSSSFVMAHRVVPTTLAEYLVWREQNITMPKGFNYPRIDDYDFQIARTFVMNCAVDQLTASLSH